MKLVLGLGFVMPRYEHLCLPCYYPLLPCYTFRRLSHILCSSQLPEEARELEKELKQITKEKNEAVRGQDFEKVLMRC